MDMMIKSVISPMIFARCDDNNNIKSFTLRFKDGDTKMWLDVELTKDQIADLKKDINRRDDI